MNSKVKKILAVLLSAAMVMSMTFVSTAAGPRYERPELNKADTVKTTGTWSKDDKGFWSLTVENRKVTDGWYYANMQNSSTEYGWFHFGANGAMSTGWVNDKKNPSIWYYMGETKDKTEGSLTTGWVTDPRDGKKYYMDPGNGQMSRGWKVINGVWYYFSDATREGHPDGSIYKNEKTPDGYYVGTTGAWRQSSGSSSRSNPVPTPTPTPTPTPEPVMTATASTTTPQHAGEAFNKEGLKITVFKNGVGEEVDYDDSRIKNLSVTVVDTNDNKLLAGENKIKISFLYIDSDILIGKSLTTDVFTVDGITYTVTFDANGHGEAPDPITNVTYGSKIEAPVSSPTDAGYIFGGWYKEASCDNEWNFDSDTVTADTKLYAKWTEAIPTFTVNLSGNTVEFSPGLLYWDGSAFKFEENQYGFESTWNASHVNHFYWSASPSVAVVAEKYTSYTDPSRNTDDTFFASNLDVDGKTWRTLTNGEWGYLLAPTRMTFRKPSYTNAINGINIEGKPYIGLFLYPDNYNGAEVSSSTTWENIKKAGIVFLPAAGYRIGPSVSGVGVYGHYWSSTPSSKNVSDACDLKFNDKEGVLTGYTGRSYGCCVRLVKE